MHFATHDGREGRAASRLRALGSLPTPGPPKRLMALAELSEALDGIREGDGDSDGEVLDDFEEASEALLVFVARHSRDCALLAYRSPLRARGQDDMRSAVVWPAGQWPQIKLLM